MSTSTRKKPKRPPVRASRAPTRPRPGSPSELRRARDVVVEEEATESLADATLRLFADEYAVDFDLVRAYHAAGFLPVSPAADRAKASRLLTDARTCRALQEARERKSAAAKLTQEEVAARLGMLVRFDLRRLYDRGGNLINPSLWPDDVAAAVCGLDVVERADTTSRSPNSGYRKRADGTYEKGMKTELVKKVRVADPVAVLQLAMRHFGMLDDRLKLSGPTPQEQAEAVRQAVAAAMASLNG